MLLDHDALAAVLAAEAPWFEPGTAHGEHALFYGHLCGELVRRVDGRSLGASWRAEIAGPWRLDFHIGLTDAELARTVDLAGSFPAGEGSELYWLALGNPPGARDLAVVNGDAWRRAEVPAVNGHASAAGVARFFEGLRAGGVLDGVRLVAAETVAAMSAGELRAFDAVIGDEMCWGLGVWVAPDGWGMGGAGGSLGMTDPPLGLAEAYVTRQMGSHDRADALDAGLREALAG
jgi:CubicO group peptidase (beta-lactamase class C family)